MISRSLPLTVNFTSLELNIHGIKLQSHSNVCIVKGFLHVYLRGCQVVVLLSLDVSTVAVTESKPMQVQVGLKNPNCNRPENFFSTDDHNCVKNNDHSSPRLTYDHGRSISRPQNINFTASKINMQGAVSLKIVSTC